MEALEKEKERLQKMDEEEYEALTEEEKILFNREVQQALRERKRRSESRTSLSGSNSPGHTDCPGDGAHPSGGTRSHRGPRRMAC